MAGGEQEVQLILQLTSCTPLHVTRQKLPMGGKPKHGTLSRNFFYKYEWLQSFFRRLFKVKIPKVSKGVKTKNCIHKTGPRHNGIFEYAEMKNSFKTSKKKVSFSVAGFSWRSSFAQSLNIRWFLISIISHYRDVIVRRGQSRIRIAERSSRNTKAARSWRFMTFSRGV